MASIAPAGEDEDKAQSTLGSQSAFLSMLNMASKLGHDLSDIDDEESEEEEQDEDEEEDLHSSKASSFKTKRTYSAETIHEYTNDGDDSDDSDGDGQALDLAALKRARRENPGTISILGSLAGTDGKIGDDEAKANAEKLRELFELSSTEKIVTEFPAWLWKNVMIQGYMLLTERHVCFFAQLPRTNDTVIKTGYLYKKSRHTPRRHRHWFILKNDVLSYYDDPADLYFPSGSVDLRYALNAELDDRDEKHKGFNLYTINRVYRLRADSDASARQWVKQLQKVIFKSRNLGNNVKISIPIANVLTVEEVHLLGSSDTLKMSVLDNDENFAIDEYYFLFFSRTREAFEKLQSCLNNAKPSDSVKERQRNVSGESTKFKDSVKDTTTFIHARSPTSNNFEGGSSRNSSESLRGEIMDDAEFLTSDQSSPKRRSFRMSRDSIRHFSLGSLGGRRSRSPSPSPLRSSFDGHERKSLGGYPSTPNPQAEATSWTGTGKMLWSRGADAVGWVKERSAEVGTQVGTMLASPSTTLSAGVGKVSQLWSGESGNAEHARWISEETAKDMRDQNPEERFQTHFALPPSENLLGAYYGYVFRTFPFYGKMYISQKHFCFRSLLPGFKTKMVLPIKDIETARKEKAYHWSSYGLVVVIRGHEELFFEFGKEQPRDECLDLLTQRIEALEKEMIDKNLSREESQRTGQDQIWLQTTQKVDIENECLEGIKEDLSDLNDKTEEETPAVMFDSNTVSMVSFKPSEVMRFTCLTIGSRGDVQPYIALCKGLQKEGHSVKIASHAEYREWIEGHGIAFASIEGDPAELMRLCIEHGMFTVSFLKEVNSKFRRWLDDLLISAWHACKDTDVLIESPSTMAGIHIAEAMKIPYFRAFTMPWTRTRTYPHAFAVPDVKMGGGYNYMTYTIFDNLFWKASAGQINRWRKRTLGLRSTNLDKMQVNKVPFLYNFSPTVVPPPLDWVDWIMVTGYWFLDDADSSATKKWEAPKEIVDFIAKARRDGKKVVYIGFGSIVVSDPKALTETVIESVKNAGVRCILSKGWSDRLNDKNATQAEVPLPDYILSVKSAPHDWLFPKIDAAVHHGGAGTTGASLRAGLVTVIKPYFGDQYFWANRVEDLGVGLSIRKLNVNNFSKALTDATSNQKMIVKAKALGELIRQENGVATAIEAIYRDLDYAKSLIKQRESPATENLSDESWTMVDDDASPSEDLPEFKSSRYPNKRDEGRLARLSKKFNLPTATTALNPNAWNRALKGRSEQNRDEAEGRPAELDVADVKTIYGGD